MNGKIIVISLLIGVLVITLASVLGYHMRQDYLEYEAGRDITGGMYDRVSVPVTAPAYATVQATTVVPEPLATALAVSPSQKANVLNGEAVTELSKSLRVNSDLMGAELRKQINSVLPNARPYVSSQVELTGMIINVAYNNQTSQICLRTDSDLLSKQYEFDFNGDLLLIVDGQTKYVDWDYLSVSGSIAYFDLPIGGYYSYGPPNPSAPANTKEGGFCSTGGIVPVLVNPHIERATRFQVLPAIDRVIVDQTILLGGVEVTLNELEIAEGEIRVFTSILNHTGDVLDVESALLLKVDGITLGSHYLGHLTIYPRYEDFHEYIFPQIPSNTKEDFMFVSYLSDDDKDRIFRNESPFAIEIESHQSYPENYWFVTFQWLIELINTGSTDPAGSMFEVVKNEVLTPPTVTPTPPTPTRVPMESVDPVIVDMRDFHKERESNKFTFDLKYNRSFIQTTGTITGIYGTSDKPLISFSWFQCVFEDPSTVMHLKVGDTISIQGFYEAEERAFVDAQLLEKLLPPPTPASTEVPPTPTALAK